MATRPARRPSSLGVGQEEIITRRRRTIPPHADEPPVPLELWLAQQAAIPTVQKIILSKRIAGGKYARLAGGDLEPPFDFDQDKFFKRNGDGDYKFSVLGVSAQSGRTEYVTHHYESIQGYGDAASAGAGAGGAGKYDPMDELTETLKVKRMAYISKLLDQQISALDSGAPAAAGPDAGERQDLFDRELDRFGKIAVLMHKGGGESKLENIFASWLPRVFEKLAGSDPADRSLDGMEKMLAFADRLNGFRGGGEALDMNTMLLMALLGAMGNPQVQTMISQMLGRFAPAAGARPAGATSTAKPTAPAEPAAKTAAVESGAPPDAEASAVAVLRGLVWPMIRRAVELQSDAFESYADVIDNHLEGFLDHWAAMDLDTALAYVTPLDPDFVATPAARAWLSRFHAYLVENPPDAPAGGAPASAAPPS